MQHGNRGGINSIQTADLDKKQRINELLRTQIPPREYKKLSNGTLSCMICPGRPTFPTVNALAVHRSGQQHQEHHEQLQKQKLITTQPPKEEPKRKTEPVPVPSADDTALRPQVPIPYRKQVPVQPTAPLILTPPPAAAPETPGLVGGIPSYYTMPLPPDPPPSIVSTSSSGAKDYTQEWINYNLNVSYGPAAVDQRYISKRARTQLASQVDPSQLVSRNVGASGSEASQFQLPLKPTEMRQKKARKPPLTTEQQEAAKHTQTMLAKGYKQDSDGKWVKRDDVEYESDDPEEVLS